MLQHSPHTARQYNHDFFVFRENVDAWIKDFNSKMQLLQGMNGVVEENIDNTNHNYELIQKMRRQIEALENEVKTMKLMQLLSLKRTINEK